MKRSGGDGPVLILTCEKYLAAMFVLSKLTVARAIQGLRRD